MNSMNWREKWEKATGRQPLLDLKEWRGINEPPREELRNIQLGNTLETKNISYKYEYEAREAVFSAAGCIDGLPLAYRGRNSEFYEIILKNHEDTLHEYTNVYTSRFEWTVPGSDETTNFVAIQHHSRGHAFDGQSENVPHYHIRPISLERKSGSFKCVLLVHTKGQPIPVIPAKIYEHYFYMRPI